MTNSRILRQVYLTTLVLLISSIQRNFFVNGQIGSLCACQPSTYTLTLDFGLTCDDKNTTGDGIIIPAACFTKGDGPETVENEVPVSVQTIQIVELDQRLQVVNQTVEVGNFTDGSTLTYKSIIASKVDDLTSTTLPSGLQVLMTGTNAEGQSLVTTFIIRYTNNCSVYPVLVDTQVNGWVVFVSTLRYLLDPFIA